MDETAAGTTCRKPPAIIGIVDQSKIGTLATGRVGSRPKPPVPVHQWRCRRSRRGTLRPPSTAQDITHWLYSLPEKAGRAISSLAQWISGLYSALDSPQLIRQGAHGCPLTHWRRT